MEKDYINLLTPDKPKLIEVGVENKLVPNRIKIIYELTIPKNENIRQKDTKE